MTGAIVVGAGPGVGASVARRFARERMPIGLIARRTETLEATVETMTGLTEHVVAAVGDASSEAGLQAALDDVVREVGLPDVLVYNSARIQEDRVGELSAAQHLDAWAVNVVGALTSAAHILPRMAERGHGTMILTGGMPTPLPGTVSLSLGKAGLRALTQILATQFGPSGVHVATVTIHGPVAPRTAFDPDDIAEHYWRLHAQPRKGWQREVDYTGTV